MVESAYLPPGPVPERWNNLVAGYSFDEVSAGTEDVLRLDVLGNHTLDDVGHMESTTGLLGEALLPDLDQLTNDTLPGVTGALTVSVWMHRYQATILWPFTITKGTSGAGASWGFISLTATTMKAYFFVDTVQTFVADDLTLDLDTWHLLTLVKPAGTSVGTLYIDDGSTLSVSASIGQINAGTDDLIVGSGSGNPIGLWYDELYIFDEVKDVAWVEDMYNGGVGRAYPG